MKKGIILLLATTIVLIFTEKALTFIVSKPSFSVQTNQGEILVTINLSNSLPFPAKRVLDNYEVIKIKVDVELRRWDLIFLNIETTITNISFTYKVRYDIISENYIIYDGKKFTYSKSFEEIIDTISPITIRIKLEDIISSPDMKNILKGTKLYFSAKAKVIVTESRPPLNLIMAISGIYNYETPEEKSEFFTFW